MPGRSRALAATTLLLLVSCIRSDLSECASGLVCPVGTTCHAATNSCATPEQLSACRGAPTECAVDGVPGRCIDGLCVSYTCGDGIVTAPEACEPEPLNVGELTCASLGFHSGTSVGCTEVCTLDISGCSESCGDGFVNGPEECEPGVPDGRLSCVDLEGGDTYDLGMQSCPSLCSLRQERCHGFGWQPLHFPSLPEVYIKDVWVASTGKPFATGVFSGIVPEYALYEHDGNQWVLLTKATEPEDMGTGPVWGTGPDDVWFGYLGGVSHWDGTTRQHYGFDDGTDVVAISGVSTSAVFAVTAAGNLLRYDGSNWSELASLEEVPNDVFARDEDRALIAGPSSIQSWEGGGLSNLPNPSLPPYTALHGFSANDVWAIGQGAIGGTELMHFDGVEWTAEPTPATVNDLDGDSRTAVLVGDAGYARYYNGQRWVRLSDVRDSDDFSIKLFTAGASNETLLALDGEAGHVWRWSGFGWAESTHVAGVDLLDLWVDSPDRWIAIGSKDGASVSSNPVGVDPPTLDIGDGIVRSVWGAALNDVYAVGADGAKVDHFDGAAWTRSDSGIAGVLNVVHGSGATNIWAAGFANSVARFDGSSWADMAPDVGDSTDRIFVAVYVARPDFVVVGSFDGQVLIYDGEGWSPGPRDSSGNLVDVGGSIAAIHGSGPNDVWVITSTDTFYHYDASAGEAGWTAYPRPVPQSCLVSGVAYFVDVEVLAPDEAFATGYLESSESSCAKGILAHFDGEGWALVRERAARYVAIDGVSGELLVVGARAALDDDEDIFPFVWTRRWACRAEESLCSDFVDDDCDGLVDELDPDCQ